MFSEDQLEQLRSFPDIGRDDLIRRANPLKKVRRKLEWFASVYPFEFGGARWRPRPGAAARPIRALAVSVSRTANPPSSCPCSASSAVGEARVPHRPARPRPAPRRLRRARSAAFRCCASWRRGPGRVRRWRPGRAGPRPLRGPASISPFRSPTRILLRPAPSLPEKTRRSRCLYPAIKF